MDAFLQTVDSLDQQTVDKILDENSDEIANVFGGWTNVLKLCLSNPAVTNIIIDHDENFVALNRLVDLMTTDDHITQSVHIHEQTDPSPLKVTTKTERKTNTKLKSKDATNSNHNNVVCHNLVNSILYQFNHHEYKHK